jgi:hypothetical protein
VPVRGGACAWRCLAEELGPARGGSLADPDRRKTALISTKPCTFLLYDGVELFTFSSTTCSSLSVSSSVSRDVTPSDYPSRLPDARHQHSGICH